MTKPTRHDWIALGVQLAATAVVLSPLRHYVGPISTVNKKKNEEDSFPLSTYPMFSAYRRGRITIPHVIGITDAGARVPLHYRHFGKGGLNQVRRQISKALRRKDGVAVAQRYADSLARRRYDGEEDVVTVHVVRSRFLFDDYFVGLTDPQAESIHATCDVGGIAKPGPARPLPRMED